MDYTRPKDASTTLVMVQPFGRFSKMLVEMEPRFIHSYVQDLERAVVSLLGLYYHSQVKFRFTNSFGEEFTWSLAKGASADCDLAVWDYTGRQSIGRWELQGTPLGGDKRQYQQLRSQVLREVSLAVELFSQDKVRCTKCGKETKARGHSRRYYAGTYCLECWEGGVREQEAKESYE